MADCPTAGLQDYWTHNNSFLAHKDGYLLTLLLKLTDNNLSIIIKKPRNNLIARALF